ncbi:MAG: TraB/GumN family protein [Spirochaetaceae bacterium]|nr:TraB/GumN family protein [Spirochaetaceae bacterium]MDE0220105.1 TraB/GumN family protein [Spirochaetaceae bacterium]
MAPPLERVAFGGRQIVILGTAHVSQRSVEDVRGLLERERPEVVCVELDQARYQTLTKPDAWRDLDIRSVLRSRRGFLLLANMVLAAFQRRMGMDAQVRPGAEMLAAVEEAEAAGARVELCDRDVQVTLRRAWSQSGLWGRSKLLSALLVTGFSSEKPDPQEIERLKTDGALTSMISELAEYLPKAKAVLIDERDRYLAARISQAARAAGPGGGPVVAVLGAGHKAGVVRALQEIDAGGELPDTDELGAPPPRSTVGRILPWLVPAIVAAVIGVGFARSGIDLTLTMLGRWVLINGSLASLGALVALAHPVTVIVSFLAAPITSMNPTIGVGFVSGAVEALVRKPRVSDFESLQDDLMSVRGFFRNRISHALVVFLGATLGSAAGTFIGLPLLGTLLFR